MSDQNLEQAEAPDSAVEETTSQNEQPATEPAFDKDKFFRGAYNEGKSKVEKDAWFAKNAPDRMNKPKKK